ncbi:30S ribosomal protein S12 methylthiotransferase RimO [Terasakiella sp.]|uniref:30S ribosomal protein S12 methylthiotransferase RimO n=1 Tax=Terasakiella sp. TaxID=2034861 RepID=UPI003AA848A6
MNTHIPKIGIVSLGCPKALVDSERILTRLRAEGYEISPSYEGADAVIVNTCGFIDSAKQESFDAIGEALTENGKVIVTGCLGVDEDGIREVHPGVLAVSGPHQYESVMEAVHQASPPLHNPHMDLIPAEGIKLTPRHYAYLKISEGCNQTCTFCIIPSMRGKLRSRPAGEVLKEAENLALSGVKEILLVSQDTGAYGSDLRYEESDFYGKSVRTKMYDLCNALGDQKVWTRLHYVYPYPHVDDVIPLMAEGKILPYLDIPFQHASPRILKLMKRPGNQIELLERIKKWREICPEITIRSTFVVGFPGETEEDFEYLLDWLEKAQLDRVGCFKYEAVEGAAANDLPAPVDEDVKEQRWNRLMEFQRQISDEKMQAKIGKVFDVIIDDVDEEGAVGRTKGDAPEIDGEVYINGELDLKPGDIVKVKAEHAEDYDIWGSLVDA